MLIFSVPSKAEFTQSYTTLTVTARPEIFFSTKILVTKNFLHCPVRASPRADGPMAPFSCQYPLSHLSQLQYQTNNSTRKPKPNNQKTNKQTKATKQTATTNDTLELAHLSAHYNTVISSLTYWVGIINLESYLLSRNYSSFL